MLPKSILPLLVSLALALPAEYFPDLDTTSITTTTEFHPPTGAGASSSSHCKLTYTVTYHDTWGPLFTENRYTCDFSKSSHHADTDTDTPTSTTPAPFRVPAPYSHPAGNHTTDPRIAPAPPRPITYTQHLQSSLSKHTITRYGCTPLPSSKPLSRNKYSNLFWGIQQLSNQSCLAPGEAAEFVDLSDRDWTADWRFTSVNRGDSKACDWYGELANIARALHYFCFHTLGRAAEEEFSGGEEIVAYGRGQEAEGEGSMRWCMRYSKKGWGVGVFEEKCLGA
ncbi:uncharacterized protein LAJ45_06247 [Morchella importuna]|uniref:Uncharacterized protein n=1 Tax=Morchella conica CCBAS932 TaxID=1392247 RepID=A0A3N4LAE0_9PEZI|nr:uncharacterized protein LAJ45_06247 [Morchella importuna]KAH8149616.1 hypothetical protein LAJ45_06247 [Morchella importuna]RPB17611.1 hypothetical protein P167DRAFT_514889 [Morchella conica CCBAS932]